MAVISITAIPSTNQRVYGIPQTVTLVTNIPCTIFYTLTNDDPTIGSDIYVSPIEMPDYMPSVILKAIATPDGVQFSSVLEILYCNDLTRARTGAMVNVTPALKLDNAGCGCGQNKQLITLEQPPGNTVSSAEGIKTSFDGYGYEPSVYPMNSNDEAIPIFNILYSESDAEGQVGKDIGTLPAKTKVIYLPPDPEESNMDKPTFNPRAMVIFHDGTKADSNKADIFRPFFDGDDVADVNGSKYSSSYFNDGGSVSGSFVRYEYNQTDNTITFYYYDNRTCKWIISKEPYKHNSLVSNRDYYASWNRYVPPVGGGYVFNWTINKYVSPL